MRLFSGLISYLIGSATLTVGAAIIIVVLATPAVTTVLSQNDTKVVAPRIQMWLDRQAEEAVYAERRKAAALAEAEKWKAIHARIRIPSAAAHAAYAKARDQGELARETLAQPKAKAPRQPIPASQVAPQPMRPSGGYYPDLHARIY